MSRLSRRALLRTAGLVVTSSVGLNALTSPAAAATMLTFDNTDLDGVDSETGVVHESVANTDHDSADVLKQGYLIGSPYKSADLSLYWPFHEDSGSTANDLSGNANDGSIGGATLGETGLLGTSCFAFDGVDDYVNTGSDATLDFSNVTIMMWINPRSFPNDVSVFVQHERSKIRANDDDGNGTVEWKSTWGSGNSLVGNAASTGSWVHIAVTYDGTNATMYENGSQVAQDSFGYEDTSSDDFNVGSVRTSGGRPVDAYIADVRAYNVAFTQTELQQYVDVVETAGELITASKVS